MALEWDPCLAVGVSEIDDQHKELFDEMNNVLAAIRQDKSKAEVGVLVERFKTLILAHFATEEGYMDTQRYPNAPAHKARHQEFREATIQLEARIAREGLNTPLVVEIHKQVAEWLTNHITRTDKALGTFLGVRMSGNTRLS